MTSRRVIPTLVAPLAVSSLVLTVAPAASGDPRSNEIEKLVLFAEYRSLGLVDVNGRPGDHGDLFHRELVISRTRSGQVIGVMSSQTEIVA